MTINVSTADHDRGPFARVCVTGGAGMIGRRLVSQLNQRGVAVAVIDDLSSGLPMPEGVAIAHRGDIRAEADMLALFRDFRPDAVVHLAALHHIPTCETQRSLCLDINVVGTETVLHAATEAEVGRVVVASSGAVYGWSEGALDEARSPTEARDNYALSKLCNESQLRLWSEHGGGIGRVARIFNTIGGDDPNAHLLPDILAQLKADTGAACMVRLGNLTSRRDYLHADEVAAGFLPCSWTRGPERSTSSTSVLARSTRSSRSWTASPGAWGGLFRSPSTRHVGAASTGPVRWAIPARRASCWAGAQVSTCKAFWKECSTNGEMA